MSPTTPPAASTMSAPDEMQQKRDLQREQTATKENQNEDESPSEDAENEELNEEKESEPTEETDEKSNEDTQEKVRQLIPASLAKTLLRIPKKTCSSIAGLIGTIIRIIFDVKAASMIYDAIDKMIGEENTDRAFCCALGCVCLIFLAILFAPVIIASLLLSAF